MGGNMGVYAYRLAKEYGVEIIRRGKPREYTVSFGWLWWRKKYHSEWIKILVGHKDENFDLKEPLREAVNRGLSIV